MKANSVWVKVCGLTKANEAADIAALGVDAVGVVLADNSSRQVSTRQAAAIFAALPIHVHRVGVFVDAPQHEVLRIAAETGMDTVQLHGQEPPAFVATCVDQGLRVIKALPLRADQISASCLASYIANGVYALLLDTYVYGRSGGTGISGDWQLAGQVARKYPVILAGGLTPENIGLALSTVQPMGIDVSSGVEKEPGCKNLQKVEQLLSVVR